MKKNYWPQVHSKNGSSLPGEGAIMVLEHKPVLLEEVLGRLVINPDGIYVDATFGRGGHAQGILSRLGKSGKLYALDKDPQAISSAQAIADERLILKKGSFTLLQDWMDSVGLIGKVNGILLDLGVSSPQLDDPKRGFSFLRDGYLDMRMDPEQVLNATIWINSASQKEIEEVLQTYGEERFYRKISAAIVAARSIKRIETTLQLAEIVTKAHPRWEQHKHPATRTFQAIRILVNDELHELSECLEQCLRVLAINGRLVVITFHSLEFGLVKKFIQKHSSLGNVPREIPFTKEHSLVKLKRIEKGLRASKQEIALNPRARSAILQVAEKIA